MEDKKVRKIIWIGLALVLAILVVFGIITVSNPLMFVMVFPWLVDKIVTDMGVNIWLARAIAAPLCLVIIFGISLLLSFNKVKRYIGLACFVIAVSVWSYGMYEITKDFIFDPKSKEATKCYATTPSGFEYVSCGWKVHPIYGTTVLPATTEIATADWNKKNGAPVVERVTPTKDFRFFSPDGKPLVWYYKHQDGKLDFFNYPGNHPQLNKPLMAITSEIVALLFKQWDDELKADSIPKKEKENESQVNKVEVRKVDYVIHVNVYGNKSPKKMEPSTDSISSGTNLTGFAGDSWVKISKFLNGDMCDGHEDKIPIQYGQLTLLCIKKSYGTPPSVYFKINENSWRQITWNNPKCLKKGNFYWENVIHMRCEELIE